MTTEPQTPQSQPFVIIDGGLITNEPDVAVFDLDVLDSDIPDDPHTVYEMIVLHQRIEKFTNLHYGLAGTAPAVLTGALRRTRSRLAERLGLSCDLLGELLRESDEPDLLLSEIEWSTDPAKPNYGHHTADLLARTALALLDGRGESARDLPEIVLTDLETYTHADGVYRAESEDRIRFALDQHRLTTGESIDADAVIADLEYDTEHINYEQD